MTNEEIYAASKKRVDAILSSTTKIATVKAIDLKEAALKENGVKGWMAAMVIDIRNAAPLFKEEEPLDVARIVRAFYGEVAAILHGNPKLLRLTIEGDKMIAYYNTPGQEDLVSLLEDAIYVNTFNEMLQRSLDKKNMATFEIGIGLSTSECLVIKTGEGDAPLAYVGDSLFDAARMARQAAKDDFGEIVIDRLYFDNIKNYAANAKQGYWEFFTRKFSKELNMWCYHASLLDGDYGAWIEKKVK